MKNKKEQIEEIENVLKNEQIRIANTSNGFKDLMKNGVCSVHSKAIYSAGYRKATELIDEFKNRILNKSNIKLVNLDGEHKAIVDLADVLKIAAEMRQEVEK